MKRVMYLGKTKIYLTKNRIYDVVEYTTLPDGNLNRIIIKNDKGFYEAFFLQYPSVSKYFKEVTAEYRNKKIDNILQ